MNISIWTQLGMIEEDYETSLVLQQSQNEFNKNELKISKIKDIKEKARKKEQKIILESKNKTYRLLLKEKDELTSLFQKDVFSSWNMLNKIDTSTIHNVDPLKMIKLVKSLIKIAKLSSEKLEISLKNYINNYIELSDSFEEKYEEVVFNGISNINKEMTEELQDINKIENKINKTDFKLVELVESSQLLNVECSICKEKITKNAVAINNPDCDHAHHKDCLEQWFKHDKSCPICKCGLSL